MNDSEPAGAADRRARLFSADACPASSSVPAAPHRGIELHFIQLGKPVQNSHMRASTVGSATNASTSKYFLSLRDAQFQIERWRREYNTDPPHIACYSLTPSEFAPTFSPTCSTPNPVLRSAWTWAKNAGNVNFKAHGEEKSDRVSDPDQTLAVRVRGAGRPGFP